MLLPINLDGMMKNVLKDKLCGDFIGWYPCVGRRLVDPKVICDKFVIKKNGTEWTKWNRMDYLEIKYSPDISNLWEIRPNIKGLCFFKYRT